MAARLQRLLVFCGLGLTAFWALVFTAFGGFWWGAGVVVVAAAAYPAVLAVELCMAAVVGRRSSSAANTGPRNPLRALAPSIPPISRCGLLRAWVGEIGAGARTFCWEQPFRTESEPDRLSPDSTGQRGVVFVHGLFCNRAFWNGWMRRLRAEGRVPFTALTLEPLFGSIDGYTASLEAAVGRITALTGQAPLVVSHSMGGLVVRRWMGLHQSAGRVHHVVTIGTPHQGTWLARFARTMNAREMAIASEWLSRLRAASRAEDAGCFTCFYSDCDNVVFPPGNATLPGADNRLLPGRGHVQLAAHPAILTEVRHLLTARAAVPAQPPAVPPARA